MEITIEEKVYDVNLKFSHAEYEELIGSIDKVFASHVLSNKDAKDIEPVMDFKNRLVMSVRTVEGK